MQVTGALSDVLVAIPSMAILRSASSKTHFHSLSFASSSLLRRCNYFGISKLGARVSRNGGRVLTVRAMGNSGEYLEPVSPLQFESPVGQLLARILQTHPHLLPAAVDQQLENIQTDNDGAKKEAPRTRDLLYKRIAEVKAKERKTALEEIIYSLIVQKFLENGISMIPKVSATSDPTDQVDFWPNQEQKLESVHSSEALEMIQSHVSIVKGDNLAGPPDTIIQISKIKLGKTYAASIMYGYFLRRVDQRYQLERTMNALPDGSDENRARHENPSPSNQRWDPDSFIRFALNNDDDFSDRGHLDTGKERIYRLRSYVMYLDAETLQRYAAIRSNEAISLIEKQTQALFGSPDISITEDGSLNTVNDEKLSVSSSGLTMLVLEAITFGSFLWDSEGYVESKYHFFDN